ncbi:P2Y purinoceptor 4-like [Pleurodeles waltl]|uniref:P2Y purinoceptor 4-like n=1 Tax=Pleurodeles waltl TaxID=8319 RepID=UPI00370984B0
MNNTPSVNVTYCHSQVLHPFIPTLLTIIFVFGFILNTASLWIFWFHIKKWSSGMVLQFNLALTDAIITLAAPMMITYFFLGNHWPFGNFLCQLNVFFMSTHLYGSIYFLALISIHRYVAIVRHHKKSRFKRKSFIINICVAGWLILFFQGFVFFFSLRTTVVDNTIKCLNIHQSDMVHLFFYWNMLYLFPSFLLPFAISLTCYVRLVFFVSKMTSNSLRGQVMRTRSIQIITVSLVIFAICFLPIHISRTLGVIIKYFSISCNLLHKVETSYYISWVFTSANCCLDPLLYIFSTEMFYKSFTKIPSCIKWAK